MMVKFFARRGTGRAKTALEYLLAEMWRKEKRSVKPEVVKGDAKIVEQLIDTNTRKWKYTSGVLSWAPGEVVDRKKEMEIIKSYEEHAYPGMGDRYSMLWVRHEHAGHHELHFLAPRVDLETGLDLNIRPPHLKSQKYYDAWRSVQSFENNWAHPDDPARRRSYSIPDYVAKINAEALRQGKSTVKDVRHKIGDYLVANKPKNRDQVVSLLKELGYEISRLGTDSVSIKTGNKRAIRLRGKLYSKDFDLENPREWNPKEELEKARKVLESGYKSRKKDYAKRYGVKEQQVIEPKYVREILDGKRERNMGVIEGLAADGINIQPGADKVIAICGIVDDTCEIVDGSLGRDRKTSGRVRAEDRDLIQRFDKFNAKLRADADRRYFGIKARVKSALSIANSRVQLWFAESRRKIERLRGFITQIKRLNEITEEVAKLEIQGVSMKNRTEELDRFKTLDLVGYATEQGFTLDKMKSSSASKTMRRGNEKIVIKRNNMGQYLYYNARNKGDNGTIIDFVQSEKQCNLGEVRKILRSWSGMSVSSPSITADQKADEQKRKEYESKIRRLHGSPRDYLHNRGILDQILRDERFRAKIFQDTRNNIAFPHTGIDWKTSGYELKNKDFTGFSPGGKKGIWHSNNTQTAIEIVVVESAIDGLSHAQLYQTGDDVAYVSVGGSLSDSQRSQLVAIFGVMSRRGQKLTIATDSDQAGEKLAQELVGLAKDVEVKREIPKAKDWNDDLIQAIGVNKHIIGRQL
jgi:hypothetical protein